ncbi:2Fe-2S iron-sulfur cluster-binding protein [Pelomonas cellulosilytica]|uniref:(2Fe-2S)-binding protein n=1 Tax=Pelomonas cellulosilytica TaxID=2906762 RepID=A0ABS8Y3Z5_9BURK|nr:2Fe-2S iron-sulfur cluster-binding protein [Pelomonas sp. P8]MCE4556785.1 (2Fe-2S)-binding protein [Pelomonas sp. P8]
MATLTLKPSGKTFELPAGTQLLKAILDAGEQLISKCGGEAKCGACHIFVTEGRKGVSKLTPAENAKLDTLVGVSSKSRLACQVSFLNTENVTIELLGALSG